MSQLTRSNRSPGCVRSTCADVACWLLSLPAALLWFGRGGVVYSFIARRSRPRTQWQGGEPRAELYESTNKKLAKQQKRRRTPQQVLPQSSARGAELSCVVYECTHRPIGTHHASAKRGSVKSSFFLCFFLRGDTPI